MGKGRLRLGMGSDGGAVGAVVILTLELEWGRLLYRWGKSMWGVPFEGLGFWLRWGFLSFRFRTTLDDSGMSMSISMSMSMKTEQL